MTNIFKLENKILLLHKKIERLKQCLARLHHFITHSALISISRQVRSLNRDNKYGGS
jgi:hypothetical protein